MEAARERSRSPPAPAAPAAPAAGPQLVRTAAAPRRAAAGGKEPAATSRRPQHATHAVTVSTGHTRSQPGVAQTATAATVQATSRATAPLGRTQAEAWSQLVAEQRGKEAAAPSLTQRWARIVAEQRATAPVLPAVTSATAPPLADVCAPMRAMAVARAVGESGVHPAPPSSEPAAEDAAAVMSPTVPSAPPQLSATVSETDRAAVANANRHCECR